MKRRCAIAALVLAASVAASVATCVAAEDPTRHDEYGLKPDDGSDHDLSLPDPVLDRGWPVPKPGEDAPPARVAPDEDEIDPFKDEDAPPPPVKALPPLPAEPSKRAPRPLVGPDGKLDEGSPSPMPDPTPDEILEPEIDEPSEIDDEDRAPSPLDRDDAEFKDETNDPGEW